MSEGAQGRSGFRWALGIAAIHAALALAYAWITPYNTPGFTQGQLLQDIGNPDEFAHALYVRNIKYGHGMPVLTPAPKNVDQFRRIYLEPGPSKMERTHEAHQAPLYYVLAASWSKLVRVDDVVHPANGFKVRSLNALVGAATVLGAYFLALWTTRRKTLALATASIVALLPMNAALSGAVSNDPLSFCLATWSLALMARWHAEWTLLRGVGLGIVIGAAILTKSSGLLLIPAALLAISWRAPRRNLGLGAACALIALAVAAPWFARNLNLYGDFLGLNAFYATYERGVFPDQVFSGLRPFARWLYALCSGTALSAIGLFGYMDIHMSYWVYLPLLVLILVGLFRSIGVSDARPVFETPQSEVRNSKSALRPPFAAYLLLIVASYVSYNLWQVQPQARYLFPGIGLLALWTVVGLERVHRWATGVLIAGLLAANVYALAILPSEFKTRVDEAKPMLPYGAVNGTP